MSTTYWAYTVAFDDETLCSGVLETEVAPDFLPDALLPGILDDLHRQAPHLHGRAHESWSAQELTEPQYRQRQADLLRKIVETPSTGFKAPPTAVVSLLLGVCLVILASTLPATPPLNRLLSLAGVLALTIGAISLTWAAFRGGIRSNQPPTQQG